MAESQRNISGIAAHVQEIRQLNFEAAEASVLFTAVWDLADAWDNAALVDGDPEYGPAANYNVVLMLANLVVDDCDSR